ncbi:DUF2207 domain-containing protein [Kytococcus sp. Marseille-QA3725]
MGAVLLTVMCALVGVIALVVHLRTTPADGPATRPPHVDHPQTVVDAPMPGVTALEAALLVQGGSRGVLGEVVALARAGLVEITGTSRSGFVLVARDPGQPVPAVSRRVVQALFGAPPQPTAVPSQDPEILDRLRGVARESQRELRARGLTRRSWEFLAPALTVLIGALALLPVVRLLDAEPFIGPQVLLGVGLLMTLLALGGRSRLTEAGRQEARHLRLLQAVLQEQVHHPGLPEMTYEEQRRWPHGRPMAHLSPDTAMALLPYAVVLEAHDGVLEAIRAGQDRPSGGAGASATPQPPEVAVLVQRIRTISRAELGPWADAGGLHASSTDFRAREEGWMGA